MGKNVKLLPSEYDYLVNLVLNEIAVINTILKDASLSESMFHYWQDKVDNLKEIYKKLKH